MVRSTADGNLPLPKPKLVEAGTFLTFSSPENPSPNCPVGVGSTVFSFLEQLVVKSRMHDIHKSDEIDTVFIII